MALATKCPHCRTTFRVAHDQLKLRAGLVRCGHCKEIFNGIEHLLPPERPSTKVEPADPVAPSPPASSELPQYDEAQSGTAPTPAPETVEQPEETNDVVATEPEEETPPASKLTFDLSADFEREFPAPSQMATVASSDPLQRMTLMDFTSDRAEDDRRNDTVGYDENGATAFDSQATDDLDEVIEDLQRKPWRHSSGKNQAADQDDPEMLDDDDEEEEPGFIKRGRKRQRLDRKVRNLLIGGSCVLLLIAIVQGTYLFRNQIAGMFPQTKSFLAQACDLFGCRINLPAQINAVSIESSELQALAEDQNRFVLTTLLRNNSATLQEWPYIELTLNDGNEKPLLRRVFKPRDYVGAIEERQGFSPASERVARLSFELQQIKASGYRVYLFYP